MNVQQLVESSSQLRKVSDDAQRLSSKWVKSGLLEGISKENDKNTMSMLLENQAKQLFTEGNITAGNNSASGGAGESWAGVALPLVRRVFGEIVAKEFVSVQPMNLPSGLVFFLDFKYGTTKGVNTAGESLYGAQADNTTDLSASLYEAGRFAYTLNHATASVDVSAGVAPVLAEVDYDSNYNLANLAKVVVSGAAYVTAIGEADVNAARSFVISNADITPSDILQKFTKIVGSTIVFIVGGASATASKDGTPAATATFTYSKQTTIAERGDYEAGGTLPQSQPISIPEINVSLKSESITAKTRKLKAQWTPEFATDLNAYHNVDAEAELTGILSQYISMEIDLEILDMLIKNAYTVDYWSAINNNAWNGAGFTQTSSTTGGFYNSQGSWFQTLGTKLQKVSNKIHQLSLRGGANFMVVSPTVATIIESIPGFASDSNGDKDEFSFGIQKVGSLNSRYKVYKNPYFTENLILMGYKGSQFLECGAVFAPYVPLIMTPLLYDPETFTPRKGLMTRYAKKMIRPDYYGKVYVHGLETV